MRLRFITFAGAVALAISGCVVTGQTGSGAFADGQQAYQRLEAIAYNWESNRVLVSFNRQARDSSWEIVVKDAWPVYEQSTKGEGRVWDLSGCRCSLEECLRIIDRSLTDFHREKPTAKVESADLEMQVITNLWGEVLAGLRQRLATLDSAKPSGIFEVPLEADDEVQRVLDKSPTIVAVKALLRKHGISVQSVQASQPVMFKEALTGQKWSAIATLPGVGVLAPGRVEFDATESSSGATSKPGARKPAPSQSAQR